MDTQNQFAVFGLCLCIGFFGGVLYEPFGVLRCVFGCRQGKNKPIAGAIDIVFWMVFAVWTAIVGYALHFPNFRVYMWIGYALGGILYLKTLHRILAFFENVCYNKITQRIKKAKKQEKTLKKRRVKGHDAR